MYEREVLFRKIRRTFWVAPLCALVLVGALLALMAPVAKADIAQPVTIPFSQTAPKVDGFCSPNEYGNAATFKFSDASAVSGTVSLQQDSTALYVCVQGAIGKFAERFFSVYLDTNNARESIAQNDDLALHVALSGSVTSAYRGTGVTNGYTPTVISGWTAATSLPPAGGGEMAEYRIPLNVLSQQCDKPFGLAVYHHWLSRVGDDYGWPSNKFFDQPQTWQEVMLAQPPVCRPDLVITKKPSSDPVTSAPFSYTVEVKNNGNANATGVVVSDVLPSALHFVSADPAALCAHSGETVGGTVSCALGAMAPGASKTIIIVVWPVKTGGIVNVARVSGKEQDLNLENNIVRAPTTIKALSLADLSVQKSASKTEVQIGEEFTYSITVANHGPNDANHVVVSDTLPAGVIYVGYSAPANVTCSEAGGIVTCIIPLLPFNSATTGLPNPITIKIVVGATKIGQWINRASVRQPTPFDPDPINNQAVAPITVVGLHGKIAYVFRHDIATANDFKNLLTPKGFTVQLVPLGNVLATNFGAFDLVIIADDTGSLSNWGSIAGQSIHIAAPGVPVVGLGEGGYAFFGQLSRQIGWPNGWHGPLDRVTPTNTALTYYHIPNNFGSPVPNPMPLYTHPVNEVGIYLKPLAGVVPLGLEPAHDDHAPLIAERCDQLWGFSAGPLAMTASGRNLFVNAVVYGLSRECQPPPTPRECVTVVKTAEPPAGTPVKPGDVITYHIKYTVKDDPACKALEARLADPIPKDTIYVPNSASDGITPGMDGALHWFLGNLAPGASGEKTFKVYVTDAQCNDQRRVVNQARFFSTLGVVNSNIVTHPVKCPPVTPAGTQPPYAEDEIQVYPYPLITGHPTDFSVRIHNLLSITQQVSVTFMTSPQRFGIGLDFNALPGGQQVVSIPGNGYVEVHLNWTPVSSGHYCILVKIEGAGFAPIYTQRNLDVTEDLQPGVEDTLQFAVRNPKPNPANMLLVVDNTCPGWTATVDPTILTNMAPGEVRTATLHVVPPTDHPLGTECHIDVQGWIGSELIGGIRKLDVPPVHLPHSDPFWMENEISVNPDPPVVAKPAQICVQLQNPMGFARTVDLDYAVADFGAGIDFTSVATKTVTLPPNSNNNYCIPWVPASGGTLHRCILITLSQQGFEDQHSQHNVDLRRFTFGSIQDLLNIQIPFSIGNTARYSRALEIRPVLIGLSPLFHVHVTPDPPPFLMPGQQMQFNLSLEQTGAQQATAAAVGTAPAQAGADSLPAYGDVKRVEVGEYLDGELVGGFSVQFEPSQSVYLPLVKK